MLKELMKSNLGGLSFAEIRLREALFYVDTAVRINETGIEREIKETEKRMYIQEQAAMRLRTTALVTGRPPENAGTPQPPATPPWPAKLLVDPTT